VKRKTVEHFLAAPDTVRSDARERHRYEERKAKEAAEQARLLSAKAKSRPTIEQMLADVVRVADDEETNPWHQFRSISRRRYELFGFYPVAWIDAEFGTFSHAKAVAGLADRVGTQQWRRKRADASRTEHASRYFQRYVEPYVADRDRRIDGRSYLLLSISDTHGSMLDPFVWMAFLQQIRDLRPDGVLLNGDIIDDGGISRHVQPRDWTQSLASELAFQRTMFAQIRSVHGGDLWLTGGNHDLGDRLPRYLTQCAPALVGLPSLRIDELLGLGEFDVKLMLGGSPLSPTAQVDAKPGFLLFGHYRVHHGTALGQTPALSELRAAGRSGQSGHVHRASLAYGTNERDEALSWMTTPMGARHEVGRTYMRGTNTGWQRGYGVARLFPDQTVHQYPAVVQVGAVERITAEGYTYERAAHLHDPDPATPWLESLRMPADLKARAGKRVAPSAVSTRKRRKTSR